MLRKAILAAVLAAGSVSASPALADYVYDLQFTDSNSDSANLFLTTNSPIGPGGTTVVSLSGMFDGNSAALANVFGADQKLYSTSPIADISGIGLVENGVYYNFYWTNPSRTGPGVYGLCFVSSCNTTSGFYLITSLRFFQVPEPMSLGLLGSGLFAAGWFRRRKKNLRKNAVPGSVP